MKSTITFEHGKTTCASESGKFCHFFGTMRFGTVPVCMLNNTIELFEKDGWTKRSDFCMAMFGEGEQ